MAVDTVQGNLFFALEDVICVRPVSGSDLDCRSYPLPSGDTLELLDIPPRTFSSRTRACTHATQRTRHVPLLNTAC